MPNGFEPHWRVKNKRYPSFHIRTCLSRPVYLEDALMAYNVYNPKDLPLPPPNTWSNIKVHSNGHFYVAGIADAGESMYEQAKNVYGAIKLLVEGAGDSMEDIMSLQKFVNNLNEYTEVRCAR